MKKLLIISRCPPYPLHLGDRLILWHLARELGEREYSIDLLAFADRESDFSEQVAYSHLFSSVKLFQEPRRSQLDYLKRLLLPNKRFPRNAAGSWSPEMWEAIEALLAQNTYDAIQFFGGVQVYEFYRALNGNKAIITPYESFSLYLKRLIQQTGGIMPRIQRMIARRFESWMFTPFERTVVIAKPDKDELLGINPALTIDVIPNGIDYDLFPSDEMERHPATLIFTGNYEYPPNVDAAYLLATEVLPCVQQTIPDAKLWIVGNAPPPEITALQSPSVDVTGHVPDLAPYLSQATVYVCPLRFGAGLKNKVLQALAASIPVIGTPLSFDGIHARHEQEALVVGIDTMSECIVRLVQDKELQRRLAKNGRKLVEEQYSWAYVASRYEAMYDEVFNHS